MGKSKKEPTLEGLNEACRGAKALGWTHEQLRARLVEAGATWDKTGLVSVRDGEGASLLSHLQHHPSWRKASVGFCMLLRELGPSYKELAAACSHLGWPRPGNQDDAGRTALVELLRDPKSELWSVIWEQREAP